MTGFLAGWAGIVAAIGTGALPVFVAATVVAGVGQGIAISAATRGLLYGSTVADRASIFSVIYLLSYSGATFPGLVAGELSTIVSTPHIAFGYVALVLAATLFTVFAARDPDPDTADRQDRRHVPS
ncbi:hypothetical protein ACFQV8_08005 [Pseudonocardia benzenivorans]